ncbi:MAG: hypothetical protein ACJ8OJ_01925 [Povalibacter sp.]
MNKIIAAVLTLMTGASGLVALGVVIYSMVLAIDESTAPRGQVYITEISAPAETPVFADAKVKTDRNRLAL